MSKYFICALLLAILLFVSCASRKVPTEPILEYPSKHRPVTFEYSDMSIQDINALCEAFLNTLIDSSNIEYNGNESMHKYEGQLMHTRSLIPPTEELSEELAEELPEERPEETQKKKRDKSERKLSRKNKRQSQELGRAQTLQQAQEKTTENEGAIAKDHVMLTPIYRFVITINGASLTSTIDFIEYIVAINGVVMTYGYNNTPDEKERLHRLVGDEGVSLLHTTVLDDRNWFLQGLNAYILENYYAE